MDPERKEAHRLELRAYFERDVSEAKRLPCILGIKVWPRTDSQWAGAPCPRAAGFAGVYLPDEVPDLYPADCPDEGACCCVLTGTVLDADSSPEGELLRERMAQRGMPAPRPPWGPIEPVTAERQAEIVTMAEEALKVLPEKDKAVWRYLRDVFSKKPTP